MASRITLENLFSQVAAWARETFPNQSPESISEHLRREATELAEHPRDSEELADIFMLAADLADKLEVGIVKIVSDKLEKCKQRTWKAQDEFGRRVHCYCRNTRRA